MGNQVDEFMREAIKEAELGFSEGGIPIGSVLVRGGKIIGRGHNRRVQHGDPTAHGEIDCFRNADRIGDYRNTVLYSTLMPCSLCAGASVLFGVPKVIVGEDRTFQGHRKFMEDHGVEVVNLDLDECYELMQKFARLYPDIWNEDIGIVD